MQTVLALPRSGLCSEEAIAQPAHRRCIVRCDSSILERLAAQRPA